MVKRPSDKQTLESRHSPYANYSCRAPDIAAVGTILTSLFVTQCRAEI